MLIIGVDPGTIYAGYGIISFKNNELSYVSSGVISLQKVTSLSNKLVIIYDKLDQLIKFYKPDEFAIETAFYGKNVQSAMKIGYARGVSLLVAAHNNLTAGEYSPREIKKAVVGNGGASKKQVQFMILKLLVIDKKNMKFDETDALAVAICHAFNVNSHLSNGTSWKKFVEKNPDKIID